MRLFTFFRLYLKMLNKKEIDEIKEKLVEVYDPVEIYIFGSYAWGNPSNESDIDLLIVIKKSNEKTYTRPIIGYKALSNLNVSKDIVVYTQEEFEKFSNNRMSLCFKVKKEGFKVYARS